MTQRVWRLSMSMSILVLVSSTAAYDLPTPTNPVQGTVLGVTGLLKRKLPESAGHFEVEISPTVCGTTPCFQLSDVADGNIKIAGTGAAEVTAGLGYYLRMYCNMTMGWERGGGSNFEVPEAWPMIGTPVTIHRVGTWSFAENVCTPSYTLVWHTWPKWEEFLDWAALWGINLLPALTGQEEVQYKVFTALGLSDVEVRGWFNGPALLTWSRGQNSHGNGVLGPLPRSWMKAQWALQRDQILPRMRELGIAGLLPAFQGNVPWSLQPLLPGTNMSQGTGQGNGTGWMDSRDPHFGHIADMWMKTLLGDFGTVGNLYQMDGFFTPTGWGAELNPSEQTSTVVAKATKVDQSLSVTCEFGLRQKNVYIPGEASDNGKTYASLSEAMAACQADEFCGGALSRHCNENDSTCTAFQTRSGMTPCPDGKACPGDIPKVIPCPKGVEVQNSYVITNTVACGHHAASPHPPPRPSPAPSPPFSCDGCPPCNWTEHDSSSLSGSCPTSVECVFSNSNDAKDACRQQIACIGVVYDGHGHFELRDSSTLVPKDGYISYRMSNELVCRAFGVDPDTNGRGLAGYAGISRTDPNATWVWQGYAIGVAKWAPNQYGLRQLKGFTTATPPGKFLLLDMTGNGDGQWRQWRDSWRTNFIWTTLHTYGGNDGLKGNLTHVNRIPFDALAPPAFGGISGLVGSGFTPEGFDQNPVYYEIVQSAPWRSSPIENMTDAVIQRAHRRYGLKSYNTKIAKAWMLLVNSSYSEDLGVSDSTGVGIYPLLGGESQFRESLIHWTSDLSQPTAKLCMTWNSWGLLIDAAPQVSESALSTFRYDLINTGREILAQLSTPFSLNFTGALTATKLNSTVIEKSGSLFADLLIDLDDLVATEPGFLLGPWLRDAKSWGVANGSLALDCNNTLVGSVIQNCSHFYEWNARTQITTWYPTALDALAVPARDTDYARKHWSPLIRDYYAERAVLLMNLGIRNAQQGVPLNLTESDLMRASLAYNWTTSTTIYPLEPYPNYVNVSRYMREKYSSFFSVC